MKITIIKLTLYFLQLKKNKSKQLIMIINNIPDMNMETQPHPHTPITGRH